MGGILHIDTSGENGLVAIAKDSQLLHSINCTNSRNQAAEINLLVEQVMSQAEMKLSSIEAVAVIGGPGSYTGLRIGLGTAKGLCYALDKPLIMHNRLTLLALQLRQEHTNKYEMYGTALKAREGEYFFAFYDEEGLEVVAPIHVSEQELGDQINSRACSMLISGVSTEAIGNMVNKEQVQFVDNEDIDLNLWVRTAEEDKNCNKYVILSTAEPFYLKQVHTHNSNKTR